MPATELKKGAHIPVCDYRGILGFSTEEKYSDAEYNKTN